MSSVGSLLLTKQVGHETAIIKSEISVKDKTYGTSEAWDYMETYLCGKQNLQAFFQYLKGKAQALARLGSKFI